MTVATKDQTNPPKGGRKLPGLFLSRTYSPFISAFNAKRTMSTSAKPVPARVYFNPDKEKELIINENNGRTGVYRWVHIESGKSYIGSSAKLNIRFRQYFNYNHISYPKRNLIIYKALLKHGYSGFRLEILEYCSSEVLQARLQYYLDSFKPQYNISAISIPKVTPSASAQRLCNESWAGGGVKIHRKYFHSGNPHRIIPIMSYIDVLAEKKAILQENNDKSGVYRWINKETGESYVGSWPLRGAKPGNLSKRFRVYFSDPST
jgi:hypothetical protein